MSDIDHVTEVVLKAKSQALREMKGPLEPAYTGRVHWPAECTVGPGLEGAIACESKVGYVNGSQGALFYRGYNIYDLCAHSSYEEVAYLLTHGRLPTPNQLDAFNRKIVEYAHVPKTLRLLMSFPVEEMNVMAALRLGTNLMRQEFTSVDSEVAKRDVSQAIGTDEDSVPMETMPHGEEQAVYEFEKNQALHTRIRALRQEEDRIAGYRSCHHLIAGVGTIAAAIARLRQGKMPIEPDPDLGFAANYLYMLTGRRPTETEARVMDIALILHADHGMNASTFASIVVASTLSDMYASVGAGIAALNGPLHGGANEQVVRMLERIGSAENVKAWFERAQARKQRVSGFGHRVYKTYDPRARVLGPLAKSLARANKDTVDLYKTAIALEKEVVSTLGKDKGIYPNVDFYSGLVYRALDIPTELFTATFAVSRVSGWTARVLEYLANNRLFRPRAIYTGPIEVDYVPIQQRAKKSPPRKDPTETVAAS